MISRFPRPADTARRLFLALGVAALGALAALTSVPSAEAATASAQSPIDLSQYRGKVVYLDFWASWCAPCKLSFRFMNELRVLYGSNDLVILTVNMDHNRQAAGNFLSDVGSNLPVVYDPSGSLASRFKVSAMPTTVLIGRDGRVRYVHRGYFDSKDTEYQQHIDALVAEHS
ncbi:MAG: TlpA family protein disulfide reductase [Sphingomonadales bacterium]|nr:TlpA family protein disulfide reductase [Sphingomonadales bacterium]MDE2568989.1 TlpA family protein disulfide reductase [Sphingomonadales bacterium]